MLLTRRLTKAWLLALMLPWLVPTSMAAAPGAELQVGALRISVSALTDDILRVRLAPHGTFPEDASWVVPENVRHASVAVQSWQDADAVGFRTATLSVRIERSPLRLIITDLAGKVLSADAADPALEVHGDAFTLRKVLPEAEHYFGLGDKAGPLDRRGQAFVNWNTDSYRYQESTDPLYKSIPFFIASGGVAGSYGIFLDNTWRSAFDFGKQDPKVLSFGAVAGPIDYYFIYGPSVPQVVARYTDLSGKAPLAPLWSLGFQQSRYSYMSATEVRGIATRLRSERIPADVIWLDIDYQDRNRPFTTNKTTFPDLPSLIKDLRHKGLRLIAITDLHIADAPDQHYRPFDSGMVGDHFLRRADGTTYVADVWPGAAVFPDFTRSNTRRWWGNLYADFSVAGIAGFWNDMNEPAIFHTASKTMPLDIQHRIDEPGFAPRTATHAEIHNIYGMENSRATFDGLRQLLPDERPYVMTRASFAGGQRYAVTWTGDNSSTWNHLKLSIPMLLNLGLSGFSYSGADVGGYAGAPSADLLTRWLEIGAFVPVFRDHYGKGDIRKEPWVDGPQHTAIRRHYIEERYRLLPYIYALADENARRGTPLMRPVFYEFPQALAAPCDQATFFMLGGQLLVAPAPDLESPAPYAICLPGGRWYNYWTGLEISTARQRLLMEAPALARLPVFVRGGAILPRQPLVQSTNDTPQGPLELDVYPGDNCHGEIYADDGHSMGYTRGEFLRQTVRCTATSDALSIEFDKREGRYHPWWRQMKITVHGWEGPARVALDGQPLAVIVNSKKRSLALRISDRVAPAWLVIRGKVTA